jgi:hypothetical protein
MIIHIKIPATQAYDAMPIHDTHFGTMPVPAVFFPIDIHHHALVYHMLRRDLTLLEHSSLGRIFIRSTHETYKIKEITPRNIALHQNSKSNVLLKRDAAIRDKAVKMKKFNMALRIFIIFVPNATYHARASSHVAWMSLLAHAAPCSEQLLRGQVTTTEVNETSFPWGTE